MTQILAVATGLSLLVPFALYEPKDPQPAPYIGRRRMVEASLRDRARKRVAWFVLAQTLRYRLAFPIGA